MKSITVTVPLDYFALTRASDMLHGMALDLENAGKQQARRGDDRPVSERATRTDAEAAFAKPDGMSAETHAQYERETAHAEQVYEETEAEKDAAAVFGGAPGKSPSPSMFADTAETESPTPTPSEPETPASPNGPAQPAPAAGSDGQAPADTPAAPAGVELDSDGLPWDSRIHAGSKGKLKKTQQWKPKRGVDPDYKAEIEAELKAAMAAGPDNPITPAPAEKPTEPAPPAASGPQEATQSASPAPPPSQRDAAPKSAITTFPALMQRITASGIDQPTVTAAVNKQGLQALPLLAARPDLIPAVAAELFPGG